MVHSPVVALARALQVETFEEAKCLVFVRTRYGVGAKAGSASEGFDITKIRHRDTTPPPGVPVWWKGGKFGHVAISAGGGRVISTDWPRPGSVGRVGIARLTEAWNKTYKGWSEDINGVNIMKTPQVRFATLENAAKKDPARPTGVGTPGAGDDVAVVEAALYCAGLSLEQKHVFDGSFGHRTLRAYAEWQRKVGMEGKTPNGLPGRESLELLARKFGFAVAD